MQKTATTGIALLLLLALTPATSADPATSYPYTSGVGYHLGDLPTHPFVSCHDVPGTDAFDVCIPSGRSLAVLFFPNRDCHYCWPDPGPIGGTVYYSSDGRLYDNGVFIPEDKVWEDNTGVTACMYDPDGDAICDEDPDDGDVDIASGWTCGQATVLGHPTDSVTYDEATVWTLTVALYDDFGEVCGATTGTILGDLY